MSAPQTESSPYDARIRRAEHLVRTYASAAEVLNLYSRVAEFQKNLFRQLVSEGKRLGDFASQQRGELNLTILLPHFRGFLSLIEQNAPAPLAQSAKQIAGSPSDSWASLLTEYWKSAGREDQRASTFEQFFPRAFLQPYAELLANRTARPPAVTTVMVCPLCDARPVAGVLRPEGDGGKRFLLCSFCSQEWEFRRILCPACGEEQENKLPVYIAEQFAHVRVEACDTCKFCLRTVDLTKDGHAVPLVDDLAAIPLLLWAHEHGYTRLQQNLLGT